MGLFSVANISPNTPIYFTRQKEIQKQPRW